MEQKGQIFFFGRPDSLKHFIPIRTSGSEAENSTEESNENKESNDNKNVPEENSEANELENKTNEDKISKPGPSTTNNGDHENSLDEKDITESKNDSSENENCKEKKEDDLTEGSSVNNSNDQETQPIIENTVNDTESALQKSCNENQENEISEKDDLTESLSEIDKKDEIIEECVKEENSNENKSLSDNDQEGTTSDQVDHQTHEENITETPSIETAIKNAEKEDVSMQEVPVEGIDEHESTIDIDNKSQTFDGSQDQDPISEQNLPETENPPEESTTKISESCDSDNSNEIPTHADEATSVSVHAELIESVHTQESLTHDTQLTENDEQEISQSELDTGDQIVPSDSNKIELSEDKDSVINTCEELSAVSQSEFEQQVEEQQQPPVDLQNEEINNDLSNDEVIDNLPSEETAVDLPTENTLIELKNDEVTEAATCEEIPVCENLESEESRNDESKTEKVDEEACSSSEIQDKVEIECAEQSEIIDETQKDEEVTIPNTQDSQLLEEISSSPDALCIEENIESDDSKVTEKAPLELPTNQNDDEKLQELEKSHIKIEKEPLKSEEVLEPSTSVIVHEEPLLEILDSSQKVEIIESTTISSVLSQEEEEHCPPNDNLISTEWKVEVCAEEVSKKIEDLTVEKIPSPRPQSESNENTPQHEETPLQLSEEKISSPIEESEAETSLVEPLINTEAEKLEREQADDKNLLNEDEVNTIDSQEIVTHSEEAATNDSIPTEGIELIESESPMKTDEENSFSSEIIDTEKAQEQPKSPEVILNEQAANQEIGEPEVENEIIDESTQHPVERENIQSTNEIELNEPTSPVAITQNPLPPIESPCDEKEQDILEEDVDEQMKLQSSETVQEQDQKIIEKCDSIQSIESIDFDDNKVPSEIEDDEPQEEMKADALINEKPSTDMTEPEESKLENIDVALPEEQEKIIESASNIEIHKGVEERDVKPEDISVAEEALPKETETSAPVDIQKEQTLEIEESTKVSTEKGEEKAVNRKRKMSERKSISESDSDGDHFMAESASHDQESEEEEEAVQRKKPRIRGKVLTPRKATRQSARVVEASKSVVAEVKVVETKVEITEKVEKKSDEKTLQNFKFDYDENEDVVANVAAIKTLICKDAPKQQENEEEEEEEKSSDEEGSSKKKVVRRGRKGKRGRGAAAKKIDIQESSGSEDDSKSKMPDSKRTKTSENAEETSPAQEPKKKRERAKRGILKDIDTSLVIDTGDSETPVRQSRRIAQQKIREETERRDMEERMLKKMKEEAERKKKSGSVSNDKNFDPEDEQKDSASDDDYKEEGSRRKKKTKIKPSDKQWQTSSSHSEHSETDPDEFEHHRSEDPGSPLFRSDHEFSPESDVDDITQVQPVKRARTAKKQVEESSDEEDVNPNHACQMCKKTDSPEWILLCDECDCGYHCSCLKPIIFCIPSGNWYCPLCCHKKLIVNLSEQLEKLDCLVSEIEAEELKKQRQIEARKLTEITAENILKERRKNRLGGARGGSQDKERGGKSEESSSDDDNESKSKDKNSSDSSDDAPLIYKLRKRNQTAASYRFNEYDDLINSAIRKDMDEVKGMGNAGRGKDISTIIEADKEEKKQQRLDKERADDDDDEEKNDGEKESDKEQNAEGDSSGSEIGKNKKALHRKKKNRKLNNLEDTSEEDAPSDEDFKGSSSSNSDTEDYSGQSSVSESSLDLPLKKGKNNARRTRSTVKKRQDQRFINDNESSDDEPLIKKRVKKQNDSDEEDFDGAEDNSDDSTADEIDSDDLCDDTETDSSSEGNWPKKKKRVASYDKKPRKPAKKHDEDDDKAFRAGISKKKILKKESENESNGSGSDTVRGKRKTRGKKLLYLLEDDYESDDDGIKPGVGVVRPETPPEERELFRLKQEEIKKMLAAKNTEAARQLAVPTIEPIKFDMEMPRTPSPPPIAEGSSLSTIPKNVIESAKALDMDYNRIKPVVAPSKSGGTLLGQQEMSEEELAKMMEEEDFAQHQLKLAGEAIARNRLLDLEGKEQAFVPFSKSSKEKLPTPAEPKKPRMKKSKIEKNEPATEAPPKLLESRPPVLPQQQQQLPPSHPLHQPQIHGNLPPPLISNASPHQPPSHLPPYSGQPVRFPPHHQLPPHNLQERPSVLNSFPPRPELHPHHQPLHPQMRFHLQHPESFMQKTPPTLLPPQIHHQPPPPQQLPQSPEEEEKVKKGGRRKKFTPLRQDLPEANVSKVAKLDAGPPASTASVIHSTLNLSAATAPVEDKTHPRQNPKATVAVASPPQKFNPVTNPTPSVITRLIQQQPSITAQPQPRIGPYGAAFNEHDNAAPPSQVPPQSPSSRAYPSTDEIKHLAAAAAAASSKQPRPSPQSPFSEHPFVPRTMHHSLYRAPPTSQSPLYHGLPSHARLPYPFHLAPHPNNNNLRPNMPPEYASNPYAIPPQFGYYAPPAHTRQPLPPNATAAALNHPGISHHPESVHHGPPTRGGADDQEQQQQHPQQAPSEFGGLVSYFSSQQELD